MEDGELIKHVDTSTETIAHVIGVSRQVLYRALKEKPKTGRRGAARTKQEQGDEEQHYLNAERLLALWGYFAQRGDEMRAERILDEMLERYPVFSRMISPYEMRIGDPDNWPFSELWIFSNEPIELQSIAFRRAMRKPLNNPDQQIVYFVPSQETAEQLHAVLRQMTDHELHRVVIIITPAVDLMPKWFLLSRETEQGREDVGLLMPEIQGRNQQREPWDRLLRIAHKDIERVRLMLMRASLLDADDRFRCPTQRTVGGGSMPSFEVFYPELPEAEG